jgi:hypothetical protein
MQSHDTPSVIASGLIPESTASTTKIPLEYGPSVLHDRTPPQQFFSIMLMSYARVSAFDQGMAVPRADLEAAA